MQEETQHLSFIIDKDGIRSDPNKVAAIRTLPCPKTVREIQYAVSLECVVITTDSYQILENI